MAGQCPGFNLQFSHDSVAAVGYLLYAFEAGTSTPKDTFKDADGLVLHEHPMVLDDQGRPPDAALFLEETGAYDFELRDPDDVPVSGAFWPNVSAVPPPADETFVPLEGGVSMTGQFELSGAAEDPLNPTPLSQVEDLISAAVAAATASITALIPPIGAIYEWLDPNNIPARHLVLNGQAVSRDDYSALFAVFGTTFGVGDGTTTFNLPDRQGVFVRGRDVDAGVDPDGTRAMNDVQDFAIENITGSFGLDDLTTNYTPDGAFAIGADTANTGSTGTGAGKVMEFDASTQVQTSTETRPVNVPTIWIVRAS